MEAIKINREDPMIVISTREPLTDRQIDIRAKKWAELDATIKALTAERDALRDELIQEGTRQTRNYQVTVTAYARTSVDSKALKAEQPEVFAKYAKPTTQTRFSVKRI